MPRKSQQLLSNDEQPNTNALVIQENAGEQLSKSQLQFNKLTQDIANAKQELEAFEQELAKAQEKVAKKIIPVVYTISEKQCQLALDLDALYREQSGSLKKAELQTFERYILDTVGSVLEAQLSEEMDAKMKAIHDAYAPQTFEEMEKAKSEFQRNIFEKIFGIDIDEEEAKNDPDYWEKKQAEAENGSSHFFNREQRPRKKTKKQLEREAQEEEAKQLEAKDARSVYTSLAKMLHPDLEQDEQERLRKTEMMKRVTEAYSNNDFFGLLKLQLEYNMINASSLSGLAESQLGRYIAMLKNQYRELVLEKERQIRSLMQTSLGKCFTYTGTFSSQKFSQEVKGVQNLLEVIEAEIADTQNIERFRRRLKELKEEYKEQDRYERSGGISFRF
jgi:hypothetical protein